MKTDILFYQLFQSFHTLLFELIGRPVVEAQAYQFVSAEIKEKSFRFDGVFLPDVIDKPIILIEVQFQPKEDFYWEFFAEIFLYLNQYRPKQNWQAVAIFARRSFDPGVSIHFQEFFGNERILRIYLEDWLEQKITSVGIGIVQLILASEARAPELVRELTSIVEQETGVNRRDDIVEFIETVLLYKFPKMSRQEIETMFAVNDLRETRVYQEAVEEGEQRGRLEGQVVVLLKLINHKFGKVSARVKTKIEKLPVAKLEDLVEAIWDLNTTADLEVWLRNHK